MSAAVPDVDRPFTVCGIQIRPDDNPEQFLQKLARIALDEMVQFVCVLDPQGAVLQCNRAVLESAGVASDEVLGKPLWDAFWFAAAPQTQAGLRDAIQGAAAGELVRGELAVQPRVGSRQTVPFDFTLRPLRDQRSRVVFLLLEGRALIGGAPPREPEKAGRFPDRHDPLVAVRGTEILTSDNRDRYRQKIARITLDSMVQFVGLLDASGTVLEINQVALDAVGVRLSDVEGKPFWTTFWWQVSPEINDTLRESIRRAAQGEFVRWDTEIYGRAGGKETIIIDASLMPVKDEQGNVVFIAAEGRDITEKKAYEREIARQREELAVLDELKTRFFANISHEFRTPLTLMLGPIEDALVDPSEPLGVRQRERLALVERNGLRLQKLVNALLDFSRVEAGRIQAVYQPTNLAALTEDLASSFRSACESAGLTLAIQAAPLPDPVFVDPEMWEKIVLNLVSNAFKFTLSGGIHVSVSAEGDHAVLCVRDTGTGIPEAELPRIFDRFHRVEGAQGRTYEGTGIGLALVQELVKLHHGSIEVRSALGRGTTLTVRLPLGSAHLPPDRIGGERAQISTATRAGAFVSEAARWLPEGVVAPDQSLPAPPPSAFAGARVLVADDNADMRDYLRRLLGERYQVSVAADGQAALDAARVDPPELVLSDVMMPRLDGFALLREWRADPRLREIPIILLSARAGEESRIEGLEAGADDYLIKPFSARELIARVETQIRMSRLRREAGAALRETDVRFRSFANTAPAMLWLTEADGSFSFFSRGWCDFTGQGEQEALGFGWLDAVHPDDRRDARRVIVEAIRSREEFSVDFRLRAADGSYRWVMNSARPRFNPAGVFNGYAGSVIDIHERKQAAQASALLGAIVDSCDDAIISKDLNGVIRSWNQSAERLFGYTAEEAIGRSVVMLIPPERIDEEPKILEKLRRGERVDHFETIRICKDGTRLNISLTISPVKDATGRIVGASKVARDITERVRHQQSMQAANAALQRANGDLQQFVHSASHDLQEPLRMVAAYTELLQKRFGGKLGPTGDEYIGHAVQGALRMEKLLKDLRTYTQFSTAGQEPAVDVDAGAVLKKTLLNLEVSISDSGASVSYSSLPWVRLHDFQLEQVFQNLVANAIRYRSHAPPRIRVVAVPREEDWLFSVEDNGIGIDPQFKEQVFGIFKRLHSTAEYPGTGMGLAICQRIIERAGGRIWVESEPGRGSTFYFTVPRAQGARKGSPPESTLDPVDRGQSGRRGIGA